MTWATRFRVQQHFRESLWIEPLVGVLLGVLGALIVVQIDQRAQLPAQWQYSPSTASTVLSAIIGATAALTGFVVTVTVLVVQIALGTFSARYMRLWYRDPVLRGTLALLIGTLAFSFSLLRHVETNFVPDIGITVAGVLVAAGLVLFVLFFNRFVHRLRPVAVASLAAQHLQRSLRYYVALMADADDIFIAPAKGVDGQPALEIRSDRHGAIEAINYPEVVQWARKHGCLAVINYSLGDFIQVGDTLIEVYGDPGDAAEAKRTLNGLVALGIERTIEQDPAFAMRIMVDVANKALSAAINDPTTAVQVLHYIEDSLGVIGTTDLPERSWRPGAAVGMVIPYRRWEDFLALGVTEIREYGRSSIQVMRRMRAMLERLADDVLPERRAQVHHEIKRLDATVAQSFKGSIDQDRASVADPQGIGGPGRLERAT